HGIRVDLRGLRNHPHQPGAPRHRVRVRDLRSRDLHPEGSLRLRRRRGGDPRGVLDRQPDVGPSLGCPRPTVPVPGERPELFRFRRTIPESPFYLARQGRLQEASSVLRTVARTEVSSAELAAEPAIPRAPMSALFRGDLLRRAIVTIGVWIALNFSYYGLFLWLPPALAGFGIVNFGNPNTLALFLVFSALAQFPGYAASFLLVDRWGRKRTLALFLILGGLSGYVFATARDFWTLVVGLFFVSFFNLGAWGAVYPYTSELFPTQYRATGFGLAEGVGKVTAVLAPLVFAGLYATTGGVLWPLT